ncbi:MAG: trimeric intracellular cation channel family protein [Inhella sp.]|uniref:trimeric intracellular cation channel family protein n=1 Tax=Inhella sp. TaxID=1921806 RepID=UPI00391F665A
MPLSAPLSVPLPLSPSALLSAVEIAATVAFALSGLLAGARKKLDAVGLIVVAGLAAFGGGTLRDVLLDRRPFFWVEHANWLWALVLLCLGAMLFLRKRHLGVEAAQGQAAPQPRRLRVGTERAMQWPDALGLGLFTATGTQLALAMGQPAIVAVVMGVITAVCGGVLRDIVCNDIPSAFHDHRPYAVCAFLGGWAVVGAQALGWPEGAVLLMGAGLASGLRLLALATDFRLPSWE